MALVLKFLTFTFVVFNLQAKEIEKIEFPEQMDMGKGKLVLNGVGLREKTKFGMSFKVYVAGLYLPQKNSNAAEILSSPDPKVIRMVFLMSLNTSTMQEAYVESYDNNCKAHCKAARETFQKFKEVLKPVKEKSEMKFEVVADTVTYILDGEKVGTFVSKEFAQVLPAMFIGDNPPTDRLKRGLLGK